MNTLIESPKPLSDIIGAAGGAANWNPIVADFGTRTGDAGAGECGLVCEWKNEAH